jgi:arylsulfatase A-like enzyme
VTPPNVVLILADDMGYGDFGCFNDGASQTPVLDQLMGDGVCLTQHYSASPVCAPARASLLTGRYPHRTGAIDTLEHRGLDRIALRERTMGDLLKQAGYVTGLVGKWHNGALDDRFHPNARGFDEFAGFCGGWSSYWDWHLDRNGTVTPSDGRYVTDVFTAEAIEFVRRHRHEPFFLHLAYNAPHYPFEAPADDVKPFADTGRFTNAVSSLYGMLRVMDRGVGAVLDELDALDLADDTLVMFSSDNGPQFSGDGDYATKRFNCGYRGAKGLVYEGGVRLPMVVRWPNGLAQRAGTQLDDLVHFTDWLPTLLAIAGAAAPTDLPFDGVDVLPLLQGAPHNMPETRFWQWNRYTPAPEGNAAMRDGKWKLVRPAIAEAMAVAPMDLALDIDLKVNPGGRTEILTDPEPPRTLPDPPPAQLFDIEADPSEEHDLAAGEPGRVSRMEDALAAWFDDVERDRRSIRD